MARYGPIESVRFGGADVPLPVSVRLSRSAAPLPAADAHAAFATSVQTDLPVLTAEVRTRATAVAEGLALGTRGDLVLTIAPAAAGIPARVVTLAGAVLVAIEHAYEQTSPATALLRFAAEADAGDTDPFHAEDAA